jgi:hypothetical protein
MTAIVSHHDTLAASIARLWLRVYTLGVAQGLRERREQQLESDLWEHQADRIGNGAAPSSVGLEILGRTVRGMPADLLWRFQLEGPRMNIKIPFERATGLLLLLLVILVPVSTSISGYDTGQDVWQDELTRLGELSDLQVAVNTLLFALAGTGLMVAAVCFYLALSARSRILAAVACGLMFGAGMTTLAASAAYAVVAELGDNYLEQGAGDGMLTTSRAFALAVESLVGFTIFLLSASVFILALVGYRERLVPRWMAWIPLASLASIATAIGVEVATDSESSWAFLMGGLVLMLGWLVIAGFILLLGSRSSAGLASRPGLGTA